MQRKILAALTTSVLLSACGGGGSSTGGPTTPSVSSMKGKAIDGYIVGATAFLDINFNGVKDANEPSSVTGANGVYDLSIEGVAFDCTDYAPVIIDVPVGAIDEDLGEITEAYQLSYPPAFAAKTDEEIKATTPLTTLVWSSIQSELTTSDDTYTCESLKQNVDMRDGIINRVEEQEYRVAQRYNITVDEMYGDFIEEGETEIQQFAMDIVPSLQKSYDETKTLQEANPNAVYAFVEYFNGLWEAKNQTGEGWYRQTAVYTDNGYTTETVAMDDTLEVVGDLMYKADSVQSTGNGIKYENLLQLSPVDGDTTYTCSLQEFITQDADTSYGVRNDMFAIVADWDACDTTVWVDQNLKQLALTTKQTAREVYTAPDNFTTSEHHFDDATISGLAHLINVRDSIADIDATDLNAVNFISTDFTDNQAYGATYWTRTNNEFSTSSSDNWSQIMTGKNSRSEWYRLTQLTNGTQKMECSTDGSTWTEGTNMAGCGF